VPEKASSQPSPAANPDASGINSVLERNIEALVERRKREEAECTGEERLAMRISDFAGSMMFVYVHLAILGIWIGANVLGSQGSFRPSLDIVATAASLEAIFLSTFVLINQNRMSTASVKRADLNVQMSLLTEHELTRLLALVSAITDRLNVRTHVDHELDELKQDVTAEAVLDKLENAET
jgi:uncharacterized membrane protein